LQSSRPVRRVAELGSLDRMTTPQQFLESFLREKAAAYTDTRARLTPVYAKYFGEPLLHHAHQFMPVDTVRAVVEDVRQSGGTASAVTRERVRSADLRNRYRLAADGESWRIVGIDRECLFCRGTGRSDGSRCQKCGGEGWYEPDRDAV
jgi:hypothetical protein